MKSRRPVSVQGHGAAPHPEQEADALASAPDHQSTPGLAKSTGPRGASGPLTGQGSVPPSMTAVAWQRQHGRCRRWRRVPRPWGDRRIYRHGPGQPAAVFCPDFYYETGSIRSHHAQSQRTVLKTATSVLMACVCRST